MLRILFHRRSFYRYFHDKYDLLEQLINTRLNQIVDEAATEDDFLQLTYRIWEIIKMSFGIYHGTVPTVHFIRK